MQTRNLMGSLMAAAAIIATMLAAPTQAHAGPASGGSGSVPIAVKSDVGPAYLRYQVVDSDNDPYSGIYLRWGTAMEYVDRIPSNYMYYGTTVELICGTWGQAVGPYANRRWHLVTPLSGPAAGQYGWIADRYLNTPNRANEPTPGEPECY